MNGAKLKGKRVEKGYTQTDMANFIEKSFDSYSKKERGEVLFTPKEEAIIAIKLQLSLLEFNEIFFDGDLPYGKLGEQKPMENIEGVRNYLKENYNISDDAELIQALSKMKPMEIGFMTNRRNEDDK